MRGEVTMGIPRISPGLELVDDEGDEVVVREIHEATDTVDLETSDGDTYCMKIRELRSRLRDGDFVPLEPETEAMAEDDEEIEADDS
jgi:hypothetical protein